MRRLRIIVCTGLLLFAGLLWVRGLFWADCLFYCDQNIGYGIEPFNGVIALSKFRQEKLPQGWVVEHDPAQRVSQCYRRFGRSWSMLGFAYYTLDEPIGFSASFHIPIWPLMVIGVGLSYAISENAR